MAHILITGAGSGIGAGLAVELARLGHHVILSDVAIEQAGAGAAAIRSAGGSARSGAHRRDLGRERGSGGRFALGSHRRAREQRRAAERGALGGVLDGSVEPPRGRHADRCGTADAGGSPGMRRRGYGRIINMGSIHSLVASPFKSAYVAAKHGLVGFSKTIALETNDVDITINTICPSYVKTPLVDRQIAEQARTRGIAESEVVDTIMLQPMPKRVFIGFDELAGIAAFLVSPAARNITGQTIVVDGGWTAQ